MKSKLQEAIREIQESGDLKSAKLFKFNSRDEQKTVAAELLFDPSEGLQLAIKDIEGYNKKYITQKMRSEFKSLLNLTLSIAGVGDIIHVKQSSEKHYNDGQIVFLIKGTYYYSLNGSVITCGGERLTRDYNARFIKNTRATCSAGGDTMPYTIFKLTEIV